MFSRNKLRALRAEFDISQAQMADLIDVAEQTYNQKELGRRDFTLSEAKTIAEFFGKPIEDIFFTIKVNTNKTIKGTA